MLIDTSREELLRKYRLAGKIRIISFSVLLLFLLMMKFLGGYSYVNAVFVGLIFAEAILNQPYAFLIKRVDIYRFQYYQMAMDIMCISWILYYMGGIEAPIVNLAYYALILWAGVVSTTRAVFFAVLLSAVFYSSIIILEYSNLLPFIAHSGYRMPIAQMIGTLIGNVSFFFAFGYFSALASGMIKSLERKRYEDSLRHTHRLRATGYLIGYIAHDAVNHMANIIGYANLLLQNKNRDSGEEDILRSIGALGQKSADLLARLMHFTKKPNAELAPVNINEAIEDAIGLTHSLIRYSSVVIEKILDPVNPSVMGEKGRIQEVFVALILNAFEAMSGKGALRISTVLRDERRKVEIVVSDTGSGIQPQDLRRIKAGELFFSASETGKKLGLGLITTREIITKHGGTIDIESAAGKGTTFIIQLPAMHS